MCGAKTKVEVEVDLRNGNRRPRIVIGKARYILYGWCRACFVQLHLRISFNFVSGQCSSRRSGSSCSLEGLCRTFCTQIDCLGGAAVTESALNLGPLLAAADNASRGALRPRCDPVCTGRYPQLHKASSVAAALICLSGCKLLILVSTRASFISTWSHHRLAFFFAIREQCGWQCFILLLSLSRSLLTCL